MVRFVVANAQRDAGEWGNLPVANRGGANLQPTSNEQQSAESVLCAAMVKLVVHLYAGRHYGYFIDEFYYLACGRHLAWG